MANLLLARATAREKEISIRAALGASRSRVVRQLLIESLLLALGGALLGCLVTWNLLDKLVAIIPAGYIPDEAAIRVNASVLLFTLGVALVSTVLFGLAPALLAVRGDLQAPLKDGGRGSAESSRHHQLRGWLVVSEVALSLVLLSGAGLLMRSFLALQQRELGFNPEHTFAVGAEFPEDRYNTPEKWFQIHLEFLRAMRAVPGVVSAALNSPPYLWLGEVTAIQIDGEPLAEGQQVNFSQVGDRFFETVGISILQGRGISEEDLHSRRRVAVVNHAFARRYFGTRDPLSHQVKIVAWEDKERPSRYQVENPWFEIIGVSGDTAVFDWASYGNMAQSKPIVYVSYTVTEVAQVTVRTVGMSAGLEQSLRRASAGLDKEAPFYIRSLDELRQRFWFGVPRFLTAVFLTFACLGLILVSVGVFAVLSYAVSRGRRRLAFGWRWEPKVPTSARW